MKIVKYSTLVLTILLAVGPMGMVPAQKMSRSKPRLIVLTDISSLSQGEREPDDGQSMTRLMLYTNDLDLEGLIATSNMGHGYRTQPELIQRVIDAYEKVRPSLLLHDRNYPESEKLRALVKSGTPVAGPRIPVDECIGEGKDTEGSDWIIKVVDRDDPRPVWVAIWGGSADLAQALWHVRATRTPEEVRKFVSKLRVHTVYDQDRTGPWIRKEFPEIFAIVRNHGIRGMYRAGDTTLVRSRWVRSNIRGHGALGDLYVDYHGGDVWTRTLGRFGGIKEGDTPSYLYLLNNGLNEPDHPEWGSWSGRFTRDDPSRNIWTEAVDSVAGYASDPDPRMASLYRWRPAWQADFAARLDWCVKPPSEANHPPRVEGSTKHLRAKSGASVRLSVRASDPDNNKLRYHWFFYPEAGTFRGALPRLAVNGSTASFRAPESDTSAILQVIAEVTDDGQPALTSYRRFVIEIAPKKHK